MSSRPGRTTQSNPVSIPPPVLWIVFICVGRLCYISGVLRLVSHMRMSVSLKDRLFLVIPAEANNLLPTLDCLHAGGKGSLIYCTAIVRL